MAQEQVHAGASPVQTVADADARRFQVWVRMDELVWVMCRRAPGQAYQPVVVGSLSEAETGGNALEAVVWPSADALQEYYFNTQRFA